MTVHVTADVSVERADVDPRALVVMAQPEGSNASGGPRFAVQVPLDGGGPPLWFEVDEPWPSSTRLRCTRLAEPPVAGEVVTSVVVTSAVRRGPSVDVLLDRGAANRCQFVLSPVALDDRGSAVGDEEAVFWQTPSTVSSVAPRQRVPTARERGVTSLEVHVDTREQKAWTFADHEVTTVRRKLDAGDYAVRDDERIVAAVERKKTSDFASGLMRGRLPAQLAALAELPRAAVVVESSYANVLSSRLRITRSRMADLVASVQASYPQVPIVFAGSRPSAEEWTYRWLAACLSHHRDEQAASALDPTPQR